MNEYGEHLDSIDLTLSEIKQTIDYLTRVHAMALDLQIIETRSLNDHDKRAWREIVHEIEKAVQPFSTTVSEFDQ